MNSVTSNAVAHAVKTDTGGSYKKFADGLKICWGQASDGTNITFPNGINFSAPPTVFVNAPQTGNYSSIGRADNVTTSGFTMFLRYAATNASSFGDFFRTPGETTNWLAIGY